MTEYEAYQEHIRYTHDTYCRIVIRHASFSAARMLAARWKREISLEYLTEEKFVPLSTTDEYFQVPDYGETYPFSVRGQTIFLDSCSLAAALAELPEQTQEEIFLYYFQHLTQKEIGEQSGWTRSTIGRHGFMLPFSMLAICFVETWQRSASCSCVKPASLRSVRTFSPSTFKSEFGIIVHLNSIVSFW